MSRYYPSSPDEGFHERLRGGRSDICDDGDRGGSPVQSFVNDPGGVGQHNDGRPDAPMQPDDGGDLGWGDAAWNDAGGFESVLSGHLSDGFGPAGGVAPVIVFEIGNLDVNFNTLIQTTQIQNTLALLNASNGGSIDVGGDITAIGLQSASTENSADFMSFLDFS